MEFTKIKRRINDICDDYASNKDNLENELTEIDYQICKNMSNLLFFNDTITNSKSYTYIDNNILVEKIDKNLNLFNNFLCKNLEINVIDNVDIKNKNIENEKAKKIESHIKYIKDNSRFFPKTSLIDFNRVIELLKYSSNNQLNLKQISKKLDYKYITLYRAVKNVLRYRYLKSNRVNVKSTKINAEYQIMYFCDCFSKLVDTNSYFIFIDECSFNSNKRSSKIWINPYQNNIMYDKGRISGLNLILAVSKSEIFHFKFSHKKLNSDGFINYFDEIEETIQKSLYLNHLYINGKITIIYDNCTIHKSKLVKKHLENKKFRILTLPSYSPFYNICEFVFAYLKKIFYNRIYSSK